MAYQKLKTIGCFAFAFGFLIAFGRCGNKSNFSGDSKKQQVTSLTVNAGSASLEPTTIPPASTASPMPSVSVDASFISSSQQSIQIKTRTDEVHKVDIFLALDFSGSMQPIVEKVSQNLSKLLSDVDPSMDFQVGLNFSQSMSWTSNSNIAQIVLNLANFQESSSATKQLFESALTEPTTKDGPEAYKVSSTPIEGFHFFPLFPNIVKNKAGSFKVEPSFTYSTPPGNFFSDGWQFPSNQIAALTAALKNAGSPPTEMVKVNLICDAVLAYQSLLKDSDDKVNKSRAFRSDAERFVVIGVSDADNQLKDDLESCRNVLRVVKKVRTIPGTTASCVCKCPLETFTLPASKSCTVVQDDNLSTRTVCNDIAATSYKNCKTGTSNLGCATCPCLGATAAYSCTVAPAVAETLYPYFYPESSTSSKLVSTANYLDLVRDFKAAVPEPMKSRDFIFHSIGYTGKDGCDPTAPGQEVAKDYQAFASSTGGNSYCIKNDFSEVMADIRKKIEISIKSYKLDSCAKDVVVIQRGDGSELAKNKYSVSDCTLTFAEGAVTAGEIVKVYFSK